LGRALVSQNQIQLLIRFVVLPPVTNFIISSFNFFINKKYALLLELKLEVNYSLPAFNLICLHCIPGLTCLVVVERRAAFLRSVGFASDMGPGTVGIILCVDSSWVSRRHPSILVQIITFLLTELRD